VRRIAALAIVAVLLAAGCASKPGVRSRTLAKGLLLAVTAAAAGGAAGAAVMSEKQEQRLRDDLAAGSVTGRDFAKQDAEGLRWNRVGRASVLVGSLALVGLVITWQMGLADAYQLGPAEQPQVPAIYPTGSPTGSPPFSPPGSPRGSPPPAR
jgi:hypothetical protein